MFKIICLEERIVLDAAIGAVVGAATHGAAATDAAAAAHDSSGNSATLGSGKIIYVDANASSNENGQNWKHAFHNLDSALAYAQERGKAVQIWVAGGVYSPGSASGDTFQLPNLVSVFGGFSGNEKSLGDRTFSEVAVLNGGGVNTSVLTANGVSALLDHLTITGGNDALGFGGGLEANNSLLILQNDTFMGNSANNGGAISAIGSTINLSESQLNGNTGLLNGGALFAMGSSIDLSFSVLSENHANGKGGAIYSSFDTVVDNGSLIQFNSAGSDGGAIYSTSDHLTLNGSTIFSNRSNGSGGAVFTSLGDLTINSGDLSLNRAAFGGGISASSATVTVTDSFISLNVANVSGGGIHALNNSHINLLNDSVTNNRATLQGGAIFATSGDLTIDQSTLSGNAANNFSGTIFSSLNNLAITNSTVDNTEFSSSATQAILSQNDKSVTFYNDNFTSLSSQGTFNAPIMITNTTGNVSIDSSFFTFNNAASFGTGALQLQGVKGTATISNSEFTNNFGDIAGAIRDAGNNIVVYRGNTFLDNFNGDGQSDVSVQQTKQVTFTQNDFASTGDGTALQILGVLSVNGSLVKPDWVNILVNANINLLESEIVIF